MMWISCEFLFYVPLILTFIYEFSYNSLYIVYKNKQKKEKYGKNICAKK